MHSQTDVRTPVRGKSALATKTALFATAGASALLVGSAAYAQEPAPSIESVTVSA